MLKKAVLVIALAGLGMALGGCNTVEGMGKDIRKAGDKIEKAAR